MFGIMKKMFIVLISNIVYGSNHTKCLLLSNQKCMIQPTLINLHPNEYSQDLKTYRRFKSKLVQHDYRNKHIENINKEYIMGM